MELFTAADIPEIEPGDDLAAIIDDRVDLRPDDVVCVASTIVSKAEGRIADLADFPAGPRATEIADRLAELTGDDKDSRLPRPCLKRASTF